MQMLVFDAGLVVLPRTMRRHEHLPPPDRGEAHVSADEDVAAAGDQEVVAGVVPAVRVHVEVLDVPRVPHRLRPRLIPRPCDFGVVTGGVMEDDPLRSTYIDRGPFRWFRVPLIGADNPRLDHVNRATASAAIKSSARVFPSV